MLHCSLDTSLPQEPDSVVGREANTSMFSDDEGDSLEDTSSDESIGYVLTVLKW